MGESLSRAGVVVFCDLDGTLVLDNSFHAFLVTAWARGNSVQRLELAARLAPRLLGRLAGGHDGLKRRVLLWIATTPQHWQSGVVSATLRQLEATISAPIRRELEELVAAGARVVLATAAPDLYARPFARKIGAVGCLATSSTVAPGWYELRGARKAEACRQWLRAEGGASRIIVITDHDDDLPLLRLAEEAVIQAPRAGYERILAALGAARPMLRHVDPLADEPGGRYWLWFDDRPRGPLDAWEVRTILSKHRHALLYEGAGHWRRIGPGQSLEPAGLRRDCPRTPGSLIRIAIYLRRRVQRDWLGIFH